MSPNDEYLTSPKLAQAINRSIDTLRQKVQRRPDLAAMFVFIGHVRMLPVSRLDEFKAAWDKPQK